MKIELHPNAIINFNDKANALLLEISAGPKAQEKNSSSTFKPGIHVAMTLSEKDIIGEIRVGMVDGFGNEAGKYFAAGNVLMGLKDDGYLKLKRLSEDMYRIKALSDKVSVKFITDSIFEWVKNKYRNTTDLSMIDFVLRKCEEELKETEEVLSIGV